MQEVRVQRGRLTYVHPTSCMHCVQCRSSTTWRPVVMVRSSCFPDQMLTTELKRYALPLREWKDCRHSASLSHCQSAAQI